MAEHPEPLIELAAAGYRLVVAPGRGGSILRFDWHEEPLLRPVCGPEIVDVACFPLVPFSNRIANGRFSLNGREIRLSPNFAGSRPHPLHGFGWQSPWQVLWQTGGALAIEHTHHAGEWPWDYTAQQTFTLGDDGLTIELSVRNDSDDPMPAGLGFHPYFPRTAETRYLGLHRGEWVNSADFLPLELDLRPDPVDWWDGQPVCTRSVDTVYTGRTGPLEIDWPDRNLRVTMACSDELAHTVVLSPAGQDYFCAEPVTNMTDAFNRPGLQLLGSGSCLRVSLGLAASPIPHADPAGDHGLPGTPISPGPHGD